MCVIIFKKANVSIELETLKNACLCNPDGLGVAICKGQYWAVKKYLDPKEKDLKALITESEGKTAIFHARIGTSGIKDKRNIHPFHNTDFLLFHNGVIPSLNGIDSERSDTSLLFRLLENKALDKHEILQGLADKTGSKFCLVEREKDPCFFGAWQEYKDLSCSNLNFVSFGFKYPKLTSYFLSETVLKKLERLDLEQIDVEDLEINFLSRVIKPDDLFTDDRIKDYLSFNYGLTNKELKQAGF